MSLVQVEPGSNLITWLKIQVIPLQQILNPPLPLILCAVMELEGQEQRVLWLPQLQNIMKKDPEAYTAEFDQQWSRFQSMMDIFKLKPQKPHNTFSEQVMFLAHVAPSFPAKAEALLEVLIGTLNESLEIMHPQMWQVPVQALILLRNRSQFPCIVAKPQMQPGGFTACLRRWPAQGSQVIRNGHAGRRPYNLCWEIPTTSRKLLGIAVCSVG